MPCFSFVVDGLIGNIEKEVVIWTSNGAGNNQPERKGYYLQFARLHSTDINSTKLRRDLIQTHRLDKESLSRLSTQALVELLGQILGN